MVNLITMMNVELVNSDDSYNQMEPKDYVLLGRWWIRAESVIAHIEDQGSWVRDLFHSLLEVDRDEVVVQIGQFFIGLVDCLPLVQAERDSNNEAASQEAPPVMPGQLVQIAPRKFISDVLDPNRERLSMFINDADIEQIEIDHKELVQLYHRDENIEKAIDACTAAVMFNDAWDVIKGRFTDLRSFCGGLAVAFANTTSVESDFSILKWEKDDNRTALTNLSLEGIF